MKTVLLIGASASATPFDRRSFRVITAHTPRDGIALARLHHPAVIVYLIDGQPPLVGLVRDLEADPALAVIPLIVVAEKMTLDDMRCWMNDGADDCLTLDLLPDGLAAAIHARLLRREAAEQRYELAMDTLRYSISHAMPHEFRTALAGILGFASLLRDDADLVTGDEIRDMAGQIEASGRRMERQVDNYAWYARLGAQAIVGGGGVLADGQTCQAPAAIVEALAWQHADTYKRTGDLSLSLDNAGVLMHEEYVQKIVDEVIDNAFKFSDTGTPVEITTTINGSYSLAVRDHGRGMTPDQLKQLGAFMQFNRKHYEQQGGGMGLTIARGLAQLHGGNLTVQSGAGAGTMVVITLPLVGTDQAA